jgi:hypothetical protein
MDKEFDARLYDIALKEKPTLKDLNECIEIFIKDNRRNNLEMYTNRYKYLKRLYEFLVYYSDKQIFFSEEKDIYRFHNDVLNRVLNMVDACNYKIKSNNFNYEQLDQENIIDMMHEKGFKLTINRIYMLYFECEMYDKEKKFIERYELNDLNLDTFEHLNLINYYNKVLLPTKFSIKTLEEFCKLRMKKTILKIILKNLKPNMTCLENACLDNNDKIIKLIMESNKELIPNITCLENSLSNSCSGIVKLLFPYIKNKHIEMEKKLSQNLDENKPIEKKLIKKIEKNRFIYKE